jgi:galactokinase
MIDVRIAVESRARGQALIKSSPPRQRDRKHIDPVALRRAEHVVAENARVLAVAEALQSGDLPGVGRLATTR